MALFYSNVSHDSVTVSQDAHHEDSEAETAKWN